MDAEAGLICFSQALADTLRHHFKAGTFIARPAKYSVSHFIDCSAIALRLCASVIASSNAADEMERLRI
jgi:hypothetical protein